MNKTNEQRFYQALEDLFVGAKIEGESGYVNLMRIKSTYYQKVLEQFRKEVDNDSILRGDFREEFFDKLYDFFHKYFSESGSVYFVKTYAYDKIYEKVYSNSKDVALFWKTHMLYYVKSDILFQSIDVEVEDEAGNTFHFFFDVGELEAKQNNEKKELVFSFKEVKKEKDDDGNEKQTTILSVAYSERGKKTKKEEILKAIQKEKVKFVTEEVLDKAIRVFKKQSEVDFFINKNAKAFLEEQLDLYLHQLLLKDENKFTQKRLDQIKAIKTYAKKIISFIAQFEDELVKIWNKPKFVLNSNYVITLDKLSPEIIEKIAKHKGLKEQIKEWQELDIVDENFKFQDIFENSLLGKGIKAEYQYLPIDTKYFKDLELEILDLFDNLDEALDGRLIHSENYQALNTLLPKYKGKVQCIYIDPPFNLEKNADFDYKVNYKDSNWATLLENRIRLAKKYLNEKGSIFVRCDYNGNCIVRMLLDEIFGKENFRNEIIINTTQKFFEGSQRYNIATNSLFWYSVSDKLDFKTLTSKRSDTRWLEMHSGGERKPPERVILGELVYPPKGRHWTFTQEKINEMEKRGRIRWKNKEYIDILGNKQYKIAEYLLAEDKFLNSNWTDIPGYSSTTGFQTENAEKLLQRVIETASNKGNIVFDFFAGSATTQAVAKKLGRKWLGVEVGEQFFEVELPRLKKVIFGKQGGISKDLKPKYKGGGFFKYYNLEQYENTLRKIRYRDYQGNLFASDKKVFEEYIFFGDEKLALPEVIKERKDEALQIDFEKLYPNIDWPETLSNLLGKPIKKIKKGSVILQDGDEKQEIKFDFNKMSEREKVEFLGTIRDLIWWGE